MTYATDERLKSYLDTNQLHREQMCLAILGIDNRFSDVRPRNPRGGPDGGRDLEAVYQRTQRAYGAVGFINTANDSAQQKRAIKKKFKEDLESVLAAASPPEVFIFFTNLSFTAGERDGLVTAARAAGIIYCDIYDRERIRLALDSADGLAIRFQYLQIPLSDAEQAAFFARWGEDIQGLISAGFNRVESLLARLQWLHESGEILRGLYIGLHLDQSYSGEEIGHFRAFCKLYLKEPKHNIFGILFGDTDNSGRYWEDSSGRSGIKHGVSGGQWEYKLPLAELRAQLESGEEAEGPDDDEADPVEKWTPAGSHSGIGQDPVRGISIGYRKDSFIRFEPQICVRDLDDCMFILLLNHSLAKKIKSIHIYANEYKLIELSSDKFYIDSSEIQPNIPGNFTDVELQDAWVRMRPKDASAFYFRFSTTTPRRFVTATETADSLQAQ
jgi:hypothetical protein